MARIRMVKKTLSANDTGETGGHQAGILVPKDPRILSFFPELNPSEKNPRVFLTFRDDLGNRWEFAFIYYNNALFGGTRNEYRLTRMTPFMRSHNLKTGDVIVFYKEEDGTRFVRYERNKKARINKDGVLRLRGGWKIINFKGE